MAEDNDLTLLERKDRDGVKEESAHPSHFQRLTDQVANKKVQQFWPAGRQQGARRPS